MSDDLTSRCAADGCRRPTAPGRRCPSCRGEAVAVEIGVEQTTAELLAHADIASADADTGAPTVQGELGRWADGD